MRIVLDLQGAQGEGRNRGIERYSLALAEAIVRNRGDHEIVLLLSDLVPDVIDSIRGRFDPLLDQDQIRVWQGVGPVQSRDPDNSWRRDASSLIRQAFLRDLQPDMVHVSDVFGGYSADVVTSSGEPRSRHLTSATIYDFIPLAHPREYLSHDARYERHYREAITELQHLDLWLAISDFTKADGQAALGLPSSRVVNISAGCDPQFRAGVVGPRDEERLRAKYSVSRRFLMHTGGSDRRKNLARLMQAFSTLPKGLRDTHQLVLVGPMGPVEQRRLLNSGRAAGLRSGDLRLLGVVPDRDLVQLYQLAELFVMPSIHEGFGLPALEAMACGTAVLGANASSLPEVIGWTEALFDPRDVAAMADAISRGLTDADFRSELKRRGLARATQFSWDVSGQRAVRAFERVVGQKSREGPSGKQSVVQLVQDIRSLPRPRQDMELMAVAMAISANHPATTEPRLVVDVSELVTGDARTGIQRVVRSIIRLLPRHLSNLTMNLAYATTGLRGYRHAFLDPAGTVVRTDTVVEPHPGDRWLVLDLQPFVALAQRDYYATLRRMGIPVYFVVYDLLPVLLPQYFDPRLEQVHADWLRVVAAADGAACISRSVADELEAWLMSNPQPRFRPYRVGWFHLGADVESSGPTVGLPPDAGVIIDSLGSRPTFLIVSTIEPRKGHAQALDAFELLWSHDLKVNLALVGKPGWHTERFLDRVARHPELGDRLFYLPNISDEFLGDIYRASACLLQPSEGEGFGLSVVEAAQRGLGVIARDLPVFREIGGPRTTYFRGLEASHLADAVQDWLRSGQRPAHVVNQYTWDASAGQLVDFILGRDTYAILPPSPP